MTTRTERHEARLAARSPAAAVAVSSEAPGGLDDGQPLEDETAPPAGYLANVLTSLAPLLVGIAGVVGSLRLGLGSFSDPGPGLWPLLISVGIIIVAAVLLFGGRRFHDAEKLSRGSLTVFIAVATLVALVLALPYIGFEIPTAVLAFVWLKFFGRESWLLSAIVAVATTVGFWLLFVLALGIPLPRLF